jgi:hypothetical protein
MKDNLKTLIVIYLKMILDRTKLVAVPAVPTNRPKWDDLLVQQAVEDCSSDFFFIIERV